MAEEVRNLAARSADAAKETTALIENAILKVEEGTNIASETADAFGNIVTGVDKVAHIVGNIANASNNQATSISQIDIGLAQVSKVVQINSATSEQSAAASEELAGQANILKEQIVQFQLRR